MDSADEHHAELLHGPGDADRLGPVQALRRRQGQRAAGLSWRVSFVASVALLACYYATVMADSGALTAGTVAAARPDQRGATLGVHSMLGFSAGLVAPTSFGLILDLAGGAQSGWAWAASFAVLALPNLIAIAVLRRLSAGAQPAVMPVLVTTRAAPAPAACRPRAPPKAKPGTRPAARPGGRRRAGALGRERDRDPRPLPRTAVDGEGAAMRLDEALGDRQPEPGAAVGAGGRGVRLAERLQRPLQLFLRSCRCRRRRRSGRCGPADRASRLDDDPAAVMREFDRVRQEVEQASASSRARRPRCQIGVRRHRQTSSMRRLRARSRDHADAAGEQRLDRDLLLEDARACRPRSSTCRARR